MKDEGLTTARVFALRRELLEIDDLLGAYVTMGVDTEVREAAEALGRSLGEFAPILDPVIRALRRKERPVEDKVRELQVAMAELLADRREVVHD